MGECLLIFIKALLRVAGAYKYELLCLVLLMAGGILNLTLSLSLACIKEAPAKP